MKYDLNSESPCVIQMIKDIRGVYESMDDGAGQSEGISITFETEAQQFVVLQETSWLMPEDDGGTYWESDTAWRNTYSWNEMTSWYFSNRRFSYEEFLLQNERALKSAYMNSNEINEEGSTIESFSNFVFHNVWYAEQLGETVGLCHGDLGHKLF